MLEADFRGLVGGLALTRSISTQDIDCAVMFGSRRYSLN